MTDITYDPDADAVTITVGGGTVTQTAEAGPFIDDLDSAGRIIGIEFVSVSQVLAPGDWTKARRPDAASVDAAE
jgi:uncharacterized protein YuzE